MTEDEVIDLLSVITAYDKRTTGTGELNAWAEAARRGRWAYADAVNAVHEHYTENTTWLQPGHVTQRIRAQRSEPPRSTALPQATPSPAEPDHTRRVTAWLAEQLDANRARHGPGTRTQAWTLPCPYCGAAAHKPCWQTFRGKPLTSGKTITEPHRDRIQAAERESDE